MRNPFMDRGGFFLAIWLAGVLGVAPQVSAFDGCGTTTWGALQIDNSTSPVLDWTGGADTGSGTKAKDHINGKMNQLKIWHDKTDADEPDSYFWSILWDTDQQRYEFFYFDGDGAPDCDEEWVETEVPVHRCKSTDTSDDCNGEEYENDEDASTQRYKRTFDSYYMASVFHCSGEEKLAVLSHRKKLGGVPGDCDNGGQRSVCHSVLPLHASDPVRWLGRV